MLGAFCAQDLALFVAFFDLMLIPFYFLIGMWGTGDRVRGDDEARRSTRWSARSSCSRPRSPPACWPPTSTGRRSPSCSPRSSTCRCRTTSQEWIFLCFAVAFLVKMPLVPFHGWLADGYKAMPIPAVAVFSGVLSKVAAYGFLRIVLPLFPYAAVHFQTLMLLIALVSILWATAMAFTTTDARLVVAYSSVAQLGFITLGIFSLRPAGRAGRAAADGQPRPRDRAAVLHRRGARRARRRLGEAPRHGRDRVPRAGAGDAVPDRRVRDAGDARLARTSSASS